MATVVKWVLVGWLAMAALLVVGAVGKPRKPLTSGTAAVAVLLNALEIVAIIAYWGDGS